MVRVFAQLHSATPVIHIGPVLFLAIRGLKIDRDYGHNMWHIV